MNEHLMVDAISCIDEKLIVQHLEKRERLKKQKRKSSLWVKWSAVAAACAVATIIAIPVANDLWKYPSGSTENTMPPSLDNSGSNNSQQGEVDYKLVEQAGKNYIIFDNIQTYQNDGLNQLATLEFESLAELKNAVVNGQLTDRQKGIIATAFEKDKMGVITCDFNKLWEPYMPNDCTIDKIGWSGESYSFMISTTSDVFGYIHSYTSEQYQAAFYRNFENFFNNTLITVTEKIEMDENKVATKYSTSAGQLMRIRYTKNVDDKTIIVDEKYRLQMNDSSIAVSDIVPSNITLYCIENEAYYVIDLFEFTEYPSDEWLFGFGMNAFVSD